MALTQAYDLVDVTHCASANDVFAVKYALAAASHALAAVHQTA
jgi:hypothetical protein